MFDHIQFKFSLGSDNHAGTHPKVLQALHAANHGHAHAYGQDPLCAYTHGEFQRVFGARVYEHYVFTGTAANVLSLAPSLRSYQAVVCAETSHLHQDECGALEKFVGAKLWTLPSKDGRISPEQCDTYLERMGDQHYSQPRIVSLTQPTELGVCYTLEELRAWRAYTRSKNLMLHLDGARLANAAIHLKVDMTTFGEFADVISLGGTKNGLMGAEAVLLFHDAADFKFYRKQSMQLSSKTRFLAAQFHAYLHGDLWREIAQHTTGLARDLALRLREFPEIEIVHPVESNALFVRLPKAWVHPLRDSYFFYIWDVQQSVCRWMISWDWTPLLTENLISCLKEVRSCHPIR